MKAQHWQKIALVLVLVGTGFSTSKAEIPANVADVLDLPDTPFNYSQPSLPAHFNIPAVTNLDNTPNNVTENDNASTLGRVLFYETRLSANGTVSCASCHQQSRGFSDNDRFSRGFQGERTGRNSMGLANSKFYRNGRFFWDERARNLREQTLIPIQNEVEMGLTLEQMVSILSGEEIYQYLFTQAYGDANVTQERVSDALAQFIRSMVSYQSPYDQGLAQANNNVNNNFANFTQAENRGKDLFFSRRTNCAACHVNNRGNQNGQNNRAIFQADRTFNNGLDANLVNADNGVGDVSNNVNDNGRFKSPSLRNVALTAPYMHDGRFVTLEQVVEHYNSGVQAHPNLDNRLRNQNGTPRRLNLSNQDRQALVAFLRTLTDPTLATDEKFSDPFRAVLLTTSSVSGQANNTRVNGELIASNGTRRPPFVNGESITANFILEVDAAHVGQTAPIYVVSVQDGQAFAKQADGSWMPWIFGDIASLPIYETRTLSSREVVSVFANQPTTSGRYQLYVGYGTAAGDLIYNGQPLEFLVTN